MKAANAMKWCKSVTHQRYEDPPTSEMPQLGHSSTLWRLVNVRNATTRSLINVMKTRQRQKCHNTVTHQRYEDSSTSEMLQHGHSSTLWRSVNVRNATTRSLINVM